MDKKKKKGAMTVQASIQQDELHKKNTRLRWMVPETDAELGI